ncbi:hypothetical protein D5086_017068 [Populus alba]|uniref:Uncharacterized protein n=1 Tax=Populus alba TaxID=43335 RepID=A0ACC4BWW7_POPAL
MPYFNCTQEIGKPDLVPEEFHGSKSQAGVVPSTSTAAGISSSRVAENTGESSSSKTCKSNYAKLPDYLRSCLDYSSIVTNRYPVEIGKLVRLLLAEGLVQDKPGDIMEDVAANVVKELIDLGMLQEVDDERHHASFGSTGCLSRAYMRNVCGMRFLLVLDLDGKIACLPEEVGDLIHLRYLGLANSDLDELPRTLGNLQKLQTLDITMCGNLSKLPTEVLHIQQLRHLLMSKSIDDCEIRVPEGIGKMVNLHTLSGIYGGDGIARELSALTQIKDLGVKRVSEDHASELFAAIKKMESLASLSLEAEECFFDETNCALFPALDAFCPPPLLQEFYLQGGLIEIPMWLASMENLTRLTLSFSYLWENPTSVLQLLPKLKHLSLWEAYRAKLIGLQNISTLQELYLDSMHPDLARRLKGEENYKIKHIPKLKFCSAF